MAKYYNMFSVCVVMVVLLSGGLTLQEAEGHGAEKGFIGPEMLNQQLGKIKLLDIRSEKEYEQEHIPTALVIPLKEISEARLTQSGFQPQGDVVVYANSDLPAKKARVLLEAIGFTSVKALSGGFVHWKEDGFKTVSGKMKAVAGIENKSGGTSISIQPGKYDFGTISKEGGVVQTTFSLNNGGEEKVTIEEVSTSCGCTSVEVPEKVVQPGKTVSVIVKFDPNFHEEPQGKFSRTVFLQTSEGVELQTKIYVEIKD